MPTPRELRYIELGRHKARTDLVWLSRNILGLKKIVPHVHGPMTDFLQKFTGVQGQDVYNPETGLWTYQPLDPDPVKVLEGSQRRLLLAPRGWFKTSLNVIAHSIQWILNYPDVTIALIHASQEVVEKVMVNIKWHFQHNKVMRYFFPEFCPPVGIKEWGTQQYFNTPARRHWTTAPTMSVAGIESVRTGMHYHIIKFTDIVDEKNTATQDQCEKIVYAYGMCRNLLISPLYWIDIEGTRYHFSDLYGRIIDEWLSEEAHGRPHTFKIFVMGCYKKELKGREPRFTPDELDEPEAVDEKGKKISLFPEEFPTDTLEAMRLDPVTGEHLFNCTPGWAPVLMNDWTEKPIQDVQVGDAVIGWSKKNKHRYELVSSRVINKGFTEDVVCEFLLDDGTKVYATANHKWWTRRNWKEKLTYRPVQVGDWLFGTLLPKRALTEEQKLAAAWLGGIFDGEGSLCKRNSPCIHQCPRVNPEVCRRITKVLDLLGYEYKCDKVRNKLVWRINGGRGGWYRLMEECLPAKRPRFIDRFNLSGRGCTAIVQNRVMAIKPIGKEEVYWLETETGNYITQRKQSSNSQQRNNPVGTEDTAFPLQYMKWKSAEDMARVPIRYYITTVDLADTAKKKSDYTVITTCGVDRMNRRYVVDIRMGKFLPDEIVDNLFIVQMKYRPVKIKIEETGFVRGLMPTIRRRSEMTGLWPNFEFITRDTQVAKQERILSIQPWYKGGLLVFSEGLDDFVKEHLKHELSRFPKYRFDDILDTLADQFQNETVFGPVAEAPSEQELLKKAKAIMFQRLQDYEEIFGKKETTGSWDGLGGL